MNENDLLIHKDFDTFEPKKYCSGSKVSNQRSTALFKTNKNINLLGMSTERKMLCVPPFFPGER